MSKARVAIGLAFWCVLGLGLWLLAAGDGAEGSAARRQWLSDLWQYGSGPRRVLELRLQAPREVGIGDPVFVQDAQGQLRQVGEVVSLGQPGQPSSDDPAAARVGKMRQAMVREARAMLYPTAPPVSDRTRVSYVSTPDSLAWVVETLLPPERKAEIAAELSAAIEEHRDEVLAALRPVAERSVREAIGILEEELPKAVANHRQELQAIGVRYHRDIVDEELVPLVKEEIWPIVRRHGEPTVDEVGQKIWQRVSLWRFGWRFAYDKSPLPEKRMVEREWQRFVEQEALPVLEEHSDDFLAIVENSLKDSARNPKVRAVLRQSVAQVLEDPELQRVVWQIFREAAVDNPRLRESLERNWTGPEAQQAFRLAADRLEPTVRRIGDRIFGTPQTGITPEFAQVLRNQILHKDRRWFLLSDPAWDKSSSSQSERSKSS